MSRAKQQIREVWRTAVMKRAGNRCQTVGPTLAEPRKTGRCVRSAVDPHHIVSRDVAPEGGYTIDNGIAVCAECHIEAERGGWTDAQLRHWGRTER